MSTADRLLARSVRDGDCHQGHPLDAVNTYVSPSGKRYCRACKRRFSVEHKRRKRSLSKAGDRG